MTTRKRINRRFSVGARPDTTWRHLVDVADWPSWARHLRRVEAVPPGPVGPETRVVLTLSNRAKAKVAVTE